MQISPVRHDWLLIAAEINSFRQMYRLSEEIIQSGMATPLERRAALRVVNILKDVIDQPIAAASTLAKARKKFGRLLQSLQTAA